MYNDLSKLKLNLMLVRKASIRVAFFLFLVYLVVKFLPWQGWLYEELSNVSLFGSALLLFLCVTMAFLEDEVQKILNKSPLGFGGLAGQFYNPENAMKAFTESTFDKDDLFTPFDEGSKLAPVDEDDSNGVFDTFEEGSDLEDSKSEEDKNYWKEKLESIPERTVYDFKERATALREFKEKRFDLLRNEFLAHVFGTPEGDELPEGQDPLTFNPQAYHYGAYFSHVLLDMSRGEWLHYQNRLKTLFQDEYQIDFDDECNVAYKLK